MLNGHNLEICCNLKRHFTESHVFFVSITSPRFRRVVGCCAGYSTESCSLNQYFY